jgi:hypothetical protein
MKNIIVLFLLCVIAFACDRELTPEDEFSFVIYDVYRSLSFWIGVILIFISMFIKKYSILVFLFGFNITLLSSLIFIISIFGMMQPFSFLYYIDKFGGVINLFKYLFSL